MNKTSILLLLILCTLSAARLQAQTPIYRTVKAKGTVTLAATGKRLHKDQKFGTTDALAFGSTHDFVVVIDDKAAAFLLRPDASLRKYKVKPLNFTVNTKPGYILTDMQLRQFFHENDSLLLLNGRFSLILGADAFPMDEQHFFYLQYLWKGDTINKRLGHRGDTLVIDEKELYHLNDGTIVDPKEVSDQYFIRSYDIATEKSVFYPDTVRPIYIIQVPEEELKQEVQVLIDATKGQEENMRILQIDNYLAKFYGKAGDWELMQYFKALDK